MNRAHRTLAVAVLSLALLASLVASAAAAGPMWRLDSLATTTAAPGHTLRYIVQVTNVGDASADGTADPLTFTATIPAGLTATAVTPLPFFPGWDCSSFVPGASSFTCVDAGDSIPRLGSDSIQTFWVDVTVDASSGILTSRFTFSGGGALPVSTADPTTISPDLSGFGIDAFDAEAFADAFGTPLTQAGGRPYAMTTSIDFNTVSNEEPLKRTPWPAEPVKDVIVDLPPGLFGDPSGIAQCNLSELANSAGPFAQPLCPPSSQVGTTVVRLPRADPFFTFGAILGPAAVYNMVPPPDAPARFGFNVAGTVVTIDVKVRSASDYGLTAEVRYVSELAITGTDLTLWGVPADPAHDSERACAGQPAPWESGAFCSSGAPLKAFLRNPTSCTAPGVGLTTTVRADSWWHPGVFDEKSFMSHDPPGFPLVPADWGPPRGMTGCDRVPFNPGLAITPGVRAAGQPSGLSVDLTLPQPDDPVSIGTSDLRTAVVRLPFHLSASSAQGLQGCSPAQIGLHSEDDPTCPDASKLGSVTITTPALPDPLAGSVYLAGPHDNPFDTLVALYLVARGSGVIIKQAMRVDLDPLTGAMTTTLDNAPQAPFSNVHLELDGGPLAPLAMPFTCGTYTAHADLTGWNGRPPVPLDNGIEVSQDGNGAACQDGKFTPGFRAGTESPSAGSTSPFHTRITRSDDDQEIGRLKLEMPSGLAGYISRVALCDDEQASTGLCPAASQIGSVTVGAGAGPNPLYVNGGRLYLTGPYKGAPYGISVVVPAVAGPFDLGNVVVRGSIFVDKHTARLTVVSDPFPTLLQGVTLLVRDVRVAIDRPGFFFNATSCAEKTISGQIDSAEGKTANVSDRYQALECRSLGFRPRMTMRVGGRGHTRRGQTSPFTTVLRMPSRHQANIRFVRVSLPTTINARLNTINDACTRAEFESDLGKCAHAKAGTAKAVTPVLPDPLKGNVYFVKNGHPIPDLFVALRGAVAFDLIGRISIPGGKHLATTFDAAPDVPIRSFTLKLLGGKSTASIGAAANLCSTTSRRAKARVDYIGQNGKVRQVSQALSVAGCAKHHARSHHHRR
jgi:uncharacterized repeat protein (TIGR01451 family)